MPKQITLDRIQASPLRAQARRASGISIYKEDGVLRIEANYQILSGDEVIKTVARDITSALASVQRATIANIYDAIFSRIEGLELS
jgi:hypothetical protein